MKPTRRREPPGTCLRQPAAAATVGRRLVVEAAVAATAALTVPCGALAAPPSQKPPRPQPGDRFVVATGDKAGAAIRLDDLAEGGPQILVWPVDPDTSQPRDGSRLAQVLLVKLDPASLEEATREHAAEG